MLSISEDVLNQVHRRRIRAILALDLTKAFDKVKHVAIMNALSSLNVDKTAHKYITAFLSERMAELQLG